MKRKILFYLSAFYGILNAGQSFSQEINATTPWIWMGGDSTYNEAGHYGTKGTAHMLNRPGARKQSATWTDNQGNFWLFGGRREASGVPAAVYNDLWKYSPSSHLWTWVSGDTIPYTAAPAGQGVVPGIQGTASVSNVPGARALANRWKDANGNFWIQGGIAVGNVRYNDMWKYDVAANTWTWIRGNTAPPQDLAGIYGTMGTADIVNQPGSRTISGCWTDNNGYLWMFGGQGQSSVLSTSLGLSDLWKYDINSNTWTWVKGSDQPAASNHIGKYGTMGVASDTTSPGGRAWPLSWFDVSSNSLWLMGGLGYATTTSQGILNDLWKYDIATNRWTWMNGTDVTNNAGTYISKGIQGGGRVPRSRFSSTAWLDKAGNFWLFGGITALFQNNTLNDIWKYNKANNEWTWIKGDSIHNILPVFNTYQIPNPGNEIGSRGVEMSWRENSNNNVWIFGGHTVTGGGWTWMGRNDLWKIEACMPVGSISSISGTDTVCSTGDTLTYTISPVIGALHYNWSVPQGWTMLDSSYIMRAVAGSQGGTVSVNVLGFCGDSTSTQAINVYMLPTPTFTVSINSGQATLTVTGNYDTYQWYYNGNPIPGANGPVHTTADGGDYAVRVTKGNCSVTSEVQNIFPLNLDNRAIAARVILYPNPTKDRLTISGLQSKEVIVIYDITGKKIYQQKVTTSEVEISLRGFNEGIYNVAVVSEQRVILNKKIVKVK